MAASSPPGKSVGPVAEYVVHDFDLLNRHADETYARVQRLTQLRGASVFGRYSMYLGGFFLAAALAGVLFAFAYWLAFAPPRPQTQRVEVEKPIVVEKEVVVRVPVAVGSEVQAAVAQAQDLANNQSPLPISAGVPVVTDFTIFRSVEFGVDGIDEVVTGLKFNSSTSKSPSFQYCYVTIPLVGLPMNKKVDIAEKVPGADANLFRLSRGVADEVGTTIGVLQRAQRLCQFVD